jgi:hypothetical protein
MEPYLPEDDDGDNGDNGDEGADAEGKEEDNDM